MDIRYLFFKKKSLSISEKIKNLSFLTAFFVILISQSELGFSNVSLRNGNFFVGYSDLIYSGGFEPKIERVYNSKSGFKGMFGWGWGNEFEVYLRVSADGSVVIHEYGGGAQNRFVPIGMGKKELENAVNLILIQAKKDGAVTSVASEKAYKDKLMSNESFRNEQWERFRSAGKLAARKIADGTQLQSNRFSYQYITKVKGGYIRVADSGRIENFNEEGRLIKIADRNNNYIELKYGKDGRVEKMIDNLNRAFTITRNQKGFVEKIISQNGKSAIYQYNNLDELIYSKDGDGNEYRFKYSSDQRHNLVEIGYSDKTTMRIEYYGRDKLENVKKLTQRDGSFAEYAYEGDPRVKDFFSVTVTNKAKEGKTISQSKYEYTMKKKSTGEDYLYRLAQSIDGDKTETVYSECCGLPISIKRSGQETLFKYDPRGRLIRKETAQEVTELKYNDKFGKITQVSRFSKSQKKMVSWSKFEYDSRANLILAQNGKNQRVRLAYDNMGRIVSMVELKSKDLKPTKNDRVFKFKYSEQGRPVEISDSKYGTINVEYTNTGEIKKVDSSKGRELALQVSYSFQTLLDIIRPAGVSLSF